jgi:hypothetical protein
VNRSSSISVRAAIGHEAAVQSLLAQTDRPMLRVRFDEC